MRNFNFVITTDKDPTTTLASQEPGWVGIDVSGYQLSFGNGGSSGSVGAGTTSTLVENIALVQILPSETFSDSFSGFSFDEFVVQTLSNTVFVSSGCFPSDTYGINTNEMPPDISESSILTYIEKAALVLAISLRNAGHYVLAIPTEGQVSYKTFLEKYSICTSISI